MDKSWASSCLLVHREFTNPCFITIHGMVFELQMFVYVAVTEEFFFSEFAFLLKRRSIPWAKAILTLQTQCAMIQLHTYVAVSVSYDGLYNIA